jgi:RNA polymerase sigma-70 factor (ECF subfamily)
MDGLIRFLEERTPASFEAFVDEYYKQVHVVVMKRVWDSSLADDITQEVFIKIINGSWRAKEVRLGRGFLISLATSVARTFARGQARLRKRERAARTLEHFPAAEGPSPEDLEEIHDAIDKLPRGQLRCVELKFYGEMNTGEIAETLGIPQRTVQHRIKKACEFLRRLLSASQFALVLPVLSGLPSPYFVIAPPSPELAERIKAHAA